MELKEAIRIQKRTEYNIPLDTFGVDISRPPAAETSSSMSGAVSLQTVV